MVVRLGREEQWPRLKHWTRAEYHQLADAGVFRGTHVQLIAGEIVEMTPQRNEHAVAIGLMEEALRRAFGAEVWVRVQMPLALSDDSEPEPDLAVVEGSPRSYRAHPTGALLVVEIADTTVAFDTGRKASLYASAGLGDYWVVDLTRRAVMVHRNAVVSSDAPFGWRYEQVTEHDERGRVAPLHRPGAWIAVADVLPLDEG